MVATLIESDIVIRRRAPRLAGDARRAQIVDAACLFFADNGFSGPTRDLAASIGVTQALLYRYFDSKTDLIDAVFAQVFRHHWSEGALARFEAGAGAPMVDRLAESYEAMLPRMTCTSVRLFFRAGLDSYAQPIFQSAVKGWPLWSAMLDAWRAEEGVEPLTSKPMMEGERAFMLSLHNAMVMIRVREHIYRAARTLTDADEVRQIAETFDAGARVVMRRLHSGEASERRTAVAREAQEAA
ncbi:TetR/AcrR family transcriptional regulator [Hansschlegelia sp. KR7-227]|uniref:TetR/AcrR family transcriptional regulator n=1 Tax=Hansschlegelia sp. KR7-227 TaxID=3400914 RepID=UPI003C0FEAE7